MKASTLYEIVRQGKKPLVKLTDMFFDEAFGEKGMIARVTRASTGEHDPEGYTFDLDYMEHKEHNLPLQTANWYKFENGKQEGMGTATETGHADPDNLQEKMHIDAGYTDSDVPMELVEENSLMAEFVASGFSDGYVAWLEQYVYGLKMKLEAEKG